MSGPLGGPLGSPAWRAARRAAAARIAAVLLGAVCVAWAAIPLPAHGPAGLALALAILGAAAGALRLALASVPVPEESYLLPTALRLWLGFLQMLRLLPWEEGAVIGVVWLEVLHSSRPWHTALLGAALIAYLLATHLAESSASPRVLAPQRRVLAAGVVLLALGAGAGMLPATSPGAGSALLRLLAAVALIAAGALVLPYVARG